jgi:hypothetical protein
MAMKDEDVPSEDRAGKAISARVTIQLYEPRFNCLDK